MIREIQLQDFISHKDTKLEFGKGITIFVGHNGSGKSSVIDAVTFALFGKHTRKCNKNLVRRGANSASVQMRFALNSKEFQATRAMNGSGNLLSSQFELVSDSGMPVSKKISAGERKQFGESMSAEIAKVIGLDYEKLRVAAVVQQGELASIVEAQPKEFKELLNSLIGIDRLDSAYQTMRDVMQGFRDNLRDETGGYTDADIQKVEETIKQNKEELKDSESFLADLEEQRKMLVDRIHAMEKEIDRMTPVIGKVNELQKAEKLLVRHVNEKRDLIYEEITRLGRLAKAAKTSFAVIENKDEVSMRLEMVRAELEELQSKLVQNEGDMGKLKGLVEYADRLQIVDGKCPVCNSPVTNINEMFDMEHIQNEMKQKAEEKSELQRERVELKKVEAALVEKSNEIAGAEKFLSSNDIRSAKDLSKIESELAGNMQYQTRLPQQILKVEDPMQLTIDETSKSLAIEIVELRKQVEGFSHKQYQDARLEKDDLSRRLLDVNKEIGKYQKAREDATSNLDSAGKVAKQLKEACDYIAVLEKIRSLIFNRDGMVGMSLRSWALKVISAKASEYASMFNIGISRIDLSEETREIGVTCYGRHGQIDIDSLSGGEKVAAALAIRLGIAYMMGSNKLDFIILDEPTTHLDEERRKSLVKIISEAFREGAGPLSQMIIITHDSDIFENSEVDRVYKFFMTADGSRVVQE